MHVVAKELREIQCCIMHVVAKELREIQCAIRYKKWGFPVALVKVVYIDP